MRRMCKRTTRGFSLLAVLLILAVLVGGLMTVLHDAGLGLREHGQARSKEMIAGAMEHGLTEAMDALQVMDTNALVRALAAAGATGSGQWDIFADWTNESFVCGTPAPPCGGSGTLSYPPPGSGSPYTGELAVRVGLRLGQKTSAPSGEDVNSAYGYVVEVQLAVSRAGSFADTAERASVGIRIPTVYSHSP
jgi:hypothetical protein